jgi:hypothetical protein
MEPECLQTFIQISDLHFGDLGRRGEVVHAVGMKTLWTLCPFFKGLAGHEPRALIDLMDFVEEMRQGDPGIVLLVTGDLTSTGKASQVGRALQFIGAELPPPSARAVGLRTGTWLDEAMRGGDRTGSRHQAIPGNHDHWPGRVFVSIRAMELAFFWLLGRPQSHMRQWRRHLPFIQQTRFPLRGTQVHLRFLALNSDADVGGWGPQRVLARGSFHTQLQRLERELGPADPNEVRILLLHHSLAYRADHPPYKGPTWLSRLWHKCFRPSALGVLEINAASRRLLRRLLGRLEVSVILTGHTHQVHVACDHVLSPKLRRIQFLEACCGTTTQLTEVPRKWPALFDGSEKRKLDPNTLLIHRLFAENQRIVWKTETWRRGDNGFERARENALGEPWASDLVVWPRP